MNKLQKLKLLLTGPLNSSNEMHASFMNFIRSLPHEIRGIPTLKEDYEREFDLMLDELIERQATIFDRILSEDAVDAIVAFVATPAGEEVIKVLPLLSLGTQKLEVLTAVQWKKGLVEKFVGLGLNEEEMKAVGCTIIYPDQATQILNNLTSEVIVEETVKQPKEVLPDVTQEDYDSFASRWLIE
jgi:hypothetical protein